MNGLKWTLLFVFPVFLTLLIYAASYIVLVRSIPLDFRTGPGPWNKKVEYRIGGATSKAMFKPIHDLDRRIVRPEFWKTHAGDRE
jgi:hypothetical protein